MNGELRVLPGLYFKGAIVLGNGVNFGIFSRNAERMTLEIYREATDCKPLYSYELDDQRNKTGDTWHIYIEGLTAGYYYGWRAGGPFDLELGHRFDNRRLLLDPYAKSITPREDCLGATRKGLIVDSSQFHWDGVLRPKGEFKDTIIYEMHIRLFTMNKNSGVENNGTYRGVVEKIEYLKELGVTAVELLPVFEFDENDIVGVNPLTGEKLKNVWGYNPIGFYAPTSNFISGDKAVGAIVGQQVIQFRELVRALHEADIEVILDVVFNHTGEGNEVGPVVSFKGLDNTIYYMLEDIKMYYANYSGTGNTLNCSHAVVKELVLDCLRYWYGQMNVDGFRFDLAAILGRDSEGRWIGDMSLLKDIADDSVLSGAKLIAEGWDAAGGYYLGEFPCGWAEWNGKFRDTVRKFVKGDKGQVSDLATRIVGSPDLFGKYGRKPYHSINFVTAHDGFTMMDLVSYNEKHNHANGEHNRDGETHNNSWNHGVEGRTTDKSIIELRKRQIKNFMVILMLSQGVPMLLMGDEMGKTQEGNNNAYCQDNELNWLDWSKLEENHDIYNFTRKMIRFRKSHPALKRSHFFTDEDIDGNGFTDISWHGVEVNKPDWSKNSKTLAFLIDGSDVIEGAEKDNDIYVMLNSYHEDLEFQLPQIQGKKWYRIADTGRKDDFLDQPVVVDSETYPVKNRSSVIFISDFAY